MGFESVDKNRVLDTPPELRIHKSSTGTGYLTASAIREYFERSRNVELLVDEETSRIAFKRNPSEDAETFKLSGAGEGSRGADIHIKGALHQLGVDIKDVTTGWRFELEIDESNRLIIADLRELVEAHTGCVHCPECGKKCKTEQGLKNHVKKVHDEDYARTVLENTDPDEVGGAFPKAAVDGGGV